MNLLKKIVFAALSLTASVYSEPIININHINEINSMNSTWLAGENEFLIDMSIEDAQSLCGTYVEEESVVLLNPTEYMSDDDSIPDEFDARVRWPEHVSPIRNQERCGSCWAFSAAEVLTDRFAIASNGREQVVLSPEDLVSCDKTNMGCGGGQLETAWQYMKETGIVTEKCYPYNSGNGTTTSCVQHCVDSEKWSQSKHHARSYYKLNNVRDAQKEILANGPIQAAFRVYKSFMSYKSGVYQRNWWKLWDSILGGHAVKIIGWGTDHNYNVPVDYWLVANSWDTTWGEDGYFKIKRGVNMCGIESNLYAGLPDL